MSKKTFSVTRLKLFLYLRLNHLLLISCPLLPSNNLLPKALLYHGIHLFIVSDQLISLSLIRYLNTTMIVRFSSTDGFVVWKGCWIPCCNLRKRESVCHRVWYKFTILIIPLHWQHADYTLDSLSDEEFIIRLRTFDFQGKREVNRRFGVLRQTPCEGCDRRDIVFSCT